MITKQIEEIFTRLGLELGYELARIKGTPVEEAVAIPIDRVDQVSEKPSYPYGTYRLGSIKRVPTKSSFYVDEDIVVDEEIDSEKFKRTEKKRASAFISFSILHEKSLATAIALTDFAMDFFDSEEGMTFCETKGITPTLISDSVEDRTVVFDNVRYDYKAGFDLNFNFYRTKESEVALMQPPSNESIQFQDEEN
jgi:hypothetical protein